jgi:hypothetical protein
MRIVNDATLTQFNGAIERDRTAGHIMQDNDGRTPARAGIEQQLVDEPASVRVEGVKRFIHEEQRRVPHADCREGQSPTHPGREVSDTKM